MRGGVGVGWRLGGRRGILGPGWALRVGVEGGGLWGGVNTGWMEELFRWEGGAWVVGMRVGSEGVEDGG